jgi:uncharacterized iron-regulated protein
MKRNLLSIALLCSCLCANAQSRPLKPETPFKIYDTHSGEQISLNDLVADLDKTKVLFFGEEHNDTIGHILELKIMKLLSEKYRDRLTFSMEMFETDCQVVLDDYLGGFIDKERMQKEARAWNNYSDYSPMVEFAKAENIPIIAANAPRRYVNLLSKRGPKSLDSLSDNSKQYFAPMPKKIKAEGRYYEKFVGILGGAENVHGTNMFASQCLWDATMANSIYEHYRDHKKGFIYHICGRFHSDEGLGTVAQLHKKSKKLNITTISCFPTSNFEQPNMEHYQQLADYVILVQK